MSTVNINLQAKDLTASLTGVVDPTPDTVAQRSSTGTLKATTPTANDDLTTKQYVDGALASKVDKTSTPYILYGTGENGVPNFYTQDTFPTPYTLALRNENGNVQSSTPQNLKDAANKEYVDTKLANAGIRKIDYGTELPTDLSGYSDGDIFILI